MGRAWVALVLGGAAAGCVRMPDEPEPIDPYAADFLIPTPGQSWPVASEAPPVIEDEVVVGKNGWITEEPVARLAVQVVEDPEPIDLLLVVAPQLRTYCEMATTHAYFETGSAELGRQQEILLDELAECLKGDQLARHPVLVVGYADPRGGALTNLQLGLMRARNVAERLEARGIDRDRIEVFSGGESLAAMRADAWPEARRVEVRLGR